MNNDYTKKTSRLTGVAFLGMLWSVCSCQAVWAQPHLRRQAKADPVIVVDKSAGGFYAFVGGELQRYIGKLTGEFPEMIAVDLLSQQKVGSILVLVGGPEANSLVKEAALAGQVNFQGLKPEGFVLRNVHVEGHRALVVGGNDEAGTMYGAYDWLERQGIVFQLTGDILPEQPKNLVLEGLDVREQPSLSRRGCFLMNDEGNMSSTSFREYQNVITQMAKLKMNYLQIFWFSYMPFLSYSYKGEKMLIGDVGAPDSGYIRWRYDMGSYKVKDMEIGREVFARFGKQFMAADELQGIKDPDQAAAAAQDGFRRIIRYAKTKKISVWLGIDACVLPPNLARYCRRTGPLPFEPVFGTYVSPTDPTTHEINEIRMKALFETYPEADGYFLFISEGYPRYEYPEDRQLIENMRPQFEGIKELIKPFKPWAGWHTPDDAIDSMIGEVHIIQKMLEAGKRLNPNARIGIGGQGNGFVFPILNHLFPKDVPFTDLESKGVWTEKGIPMQLYAGMGERERTLIPRLDDDASMLEPQFNVNLYYQDRLFQGSLDNGLAGFAVQLYRPRGTEWDSKFLSEGAWNPHLTPGEFYQNYAKRVYGEKAAPEIVKAFQTLEYKEGFEGYYYFGPIDFPCCGPPDEISIAKWWADQRDPFDGPRQATSEVKHWDDFIVASREKIEQFRRKIEVTQQALGHLSAAEPGATPAGKYQIRYLQNREDAHILQLQTLVNLMQGYIEMDEAFRTDRLKNRPEFLDHFNAGFLKFQDARVSARDTALKYAELVDYPSDLETLRRLNVYMVTGTELIDKFITNIANFHCGKPYLKTVEWERIFSSYKVANVWE
jgi:hypothetical protein